MPFQPAPDCAEVVITGRMADAGHWVNVFHLDSNALGQPPSQAQADALAASFDAAYTNLAPYMHVDWHVDNLQLYSLETQGAPAFNSAITVVGTGSGAPLPNTCALVVTWRTDLRGRSFRGRTFLGGWTEAASDGNGPSIGAATEASDFGAAVVALDSVVLSRRTNNQLRAVGIMTEITSHSVDVIWDTMRSRKIPPT